MVKCCLCEEEAEYIRDGIYYCGYHARSQVCSTELVDIGFEEVEEDEDDPPIL